MITWNLNNDVEGFSTIEFIAYECFTNPTSTKSTPTFEMRIF